MGDESEGSRSRPRVSERWRERPRKEPVRPCIWACGDGTGKEGSSPASDVGVSCMLSGRFRRGGGGGRGAEDEDVTDLERETRGEEGVVGCESFTVGSVDVDGRRRGWVGGRVDPELAVIAGGLEWSKCVVVDTLSAGTCRLGSGGLDDATVDDASVALATCSSDNAELDVDKGRLGFRRRGKGGTHVASSDPPDAEPETWPFSCFWSCLEGLRLRVRALGELLLAEELDEVVLRT